MRKFLSQVVTVGAWTAAITLAQVVASDGHGAAAGSNPIADTEKDL